MTTVRVFWLDGIATGGLGAKMPYLSRSVTDAEPYKPISTAPSPRKATHALVQIPKGCAVLMELNPPNRTQDADRDSPMLEAGNHIIQVGESYSFSFLDATE